MEEINGERVDMIEWSEDPIKLISLALQPAAISAVIIVNDKEHLDDQSRKIKKRAAVFVEEAQRPMAIGKKGQNIRLATELSNYELDMYNYEELPAFKAKLAELRGGAPVEAAVSAEGQPEAAAEAPATDVPAEVPVEAKEEAPAPASAEVSGAAPEEVPPPAAPAAEAGEPVKKRKKKEEAEEKTA